MKFKVIKEDCLKEKLLNEMALVGTTNDSFDVVVRMRDPGKIPHFHYWDLGTSGDVFHTCIRIDCAKYFIHGGKNDVLNHTQKKNLVKFLESPYRNSDETMWHHLLVLWNDNNSDVHIDENSTMPNYMEL